MIVNDRTYKNINFVKYDADQRNNPNCNMIHFVVLLHIFYYTSNHIYFNVQKFTTAIFFKCKCQQL